MTSFFEWLSMVMFREVWAARQAQEARKAEAERRRDEHESRLRAEFDALDRRTYLRYSHAKGQWVHAISPRERFVIARAMAIIGIPAW
ncbi:MAG: hypothetical protein AAGC76_09485 [Luteibacter sp.]|uniref:hypothetical protein n=1 Tax=Luteibacter sp. TaxID=1886636 RepID=UPI0028089EF4|nr:hypothetical protein [Luteibacter sp.]MDQ7996072.1 hypothetical protein [Luteibacter sp.]